ncbi:unnamed protein product [Moneuplotes crassus]|uniref:Uncharacterized protein n=1 Tax=Euplotes crassus TaxID=5936 RepID=A0AAD1Y2C8_EUPCR|nr:unnamed protein product [Moneuplotes crassus]
MAYFSYKSYIPSDHDTYKPKEFTELELDSLKISHGERDSCKNYLAEHKQCMITIHQTTKGLFKVNTLKKKQKSHCGYYLDHWFYCRELMFTNAGLTTKRLM